MVRRWDLPSGTRLLHEIHEAVDSGRSYVLLRPTVVDLDGVEERVAAGAVRPVRRIDLGAACARPGTLAQCIHEHLALEGSSSEADPAAVAHAPKLRGNLLWLDVHDDVDARGLSTFIKSFSASAARLIEPDRPVLVAALRLAQIDPVPLSETALTIRWWWGRVGPLDTQVLVDAAMPPGRVIADLEVVAEVAAFDLRLARELAVRYSGDVRRDLAAALHDQPPARMDIDMEALAQASATEPPIELMTAWDRGCVDWWGDGAVLHAGCIRNDDGALAKRVWRGQVAAVLPFVEMRRQALAYWAWQRRHQLRDGWEQRDILSLEAGQLVELLRKHEQLRAKKVVWDMAKALKKARNDLAHLTPLERSWLAEEEPLLRAATF
jgi:hypothetical protein